MQVKPYHFIMSNGSGGDRRMSARAGGYPEGLAHAVVLRGNDRRINDMLIGFTMHIFVASHKYTTVLQADGYRPLFVGSAMLGSDAPRNTSWSYDDEYPESISKLNPFFCELTGFHYIWKQCDDDIVGLMHYRRYLGKRSDDGTFVPLDAQTVSSDLKEHDCIVAAKSTVANGEYLISVAEQYRLIHSSTDLVQTRLVISRLCPEYLDAFDDVVLDHQFSPCNILVCRKDLFDQYCAWLFSIEFELYRRIDVQSRSEPYQRRVFGFLSERLLNVYLRKHGLRTKEYPVFDPAGSEVGDSLFYGKQFPSRPPLLDTTLVDAFKPCHQGRDYSPVFDLRFYLEHNPDVHRAYSEDPTGAFEHFLKYGVFEGRASSPFFSIASYMRGNPRLQKRLGAQSALDYVRYYIDHPLARRHAIGFENITIDRGASARASRSIRSALESAYRSRMLREAERFGMID